jgi:hypothetical protein
MNSPEKTLTSQADALPNMEIIIVIHQIAHKKTNESMAFLHDNIL